jgi:hypothetical protein
MDGIDDFAVGRAMQAAGSVRAAVFAVDDHAAAQGQQRQYGGTDQQYPFGSLHGCFSYPHVAMAMVVALPIKRQPDCRR